MHLLSLLIVSCLAQITTAHQTYKHDHWDPDYKGDEIFYYLYDSYYNDYQSLVVMDYEDMVEIPHGDCNYRCYKQCDKNRLCTHEVLLPNSKRHLWVDPEPPRTSKRVWALRIVIALILIGGLVKFLIAKGLFKR